MAEPKKLTTGVEGPLASTREEEVRIATLEATVKHYLPEFAKAIANIANDASGDKPVLILRQDAFAAGYDDDQYVLLGMAIKYAGLHGVKLKIIGKNSDTF